MEPRPQETMLCHTVGFGWLHFRRLEERQGFIDPLPIHRRLYALASYRRFRKAVVEA